MIKSNPEPQFESNLERILQSVQQYDRTSIGAEIDDPAPPQLVNSETNYISLNLQLHICVTIALVNTN